MSTPKKTATKAAPATAPKKRGRPPKKTAELKAEFNEKTNAEVEALKDFDAYRAARKFTWNDVALAVTTTFALYSALVSLALARG